MKTKKNTNRKSGKRILSTVLTVLLLAGFALPLLSCDLPLPKKEDSQDETDGGAVTEDPNSENPLPGVSSGDRDPALSPTDSDWPSDAYTRTVGIQFGKTKEGLTFLKKLQEAAAEGDEAVKALVAGQPSSDLKTYIQTAADVEGLFQEIGNIKIPLFDLEGIEMEPLTFRTISGRRYPDFYYFYRQLPIESISAAEITVRYDENRPADPEEALGKFQFFVLLYTEETENGRLSVYRQEVERYEDGKYIETWYGAPHGVLITENSVVEIVLYVPEENGSISPEDARAFLDTIRVTTVSDEIGE